MVMPSNPENAYNSEENEQYDLLVLDSMLVLCKIIINNKWSTLKKAASLCQPYKPVSREVLN
jgi:hypothetical protein